MAIGNWLGRKRRELARKSRDATLASGLDARTSYFAGILSEEAVYEQFQKWTGVSRRRIDKLLTNFLEERFVDYADRRRGGLSSDTESLAWILSQGYKQGLRWRGVPLGKTCFDICIYQQLLQDLQPATIIEFGTGFGASSLFLADTCRAIGLETKIITLDVNEKEVDASVFAEETIRFIPGDVAHIDTLLPTEQLHSLQHPWFVIEDCHYHVPLIVAHLYPHMVAGDYLAIEDIGYMPEGQAEIEKSLASLPPRSLAVDTFYTDLFGRNSTCSPDAIFRKTG